MRALDGRRGFGYGGLEAKGLLDEADVVVDGLGDADDSDFEVAPRHFLEDGAPGFHGAVAADDEEHVDVAALQGIDDLTGILRSAGGAEHRAAEKMDVPHLVRGELDVAVSVFRNKALEAEGDAEDAGHVVVMVGFHDNGADDVVQPRAQAAARDNGRFCAQGVKVKVPARACGFEFQGRGFLRLSVEALIHHEGIMHVVFPHGEGEGGFDFAGAEYRDARVNALLQLFLIHGILQKKVWPPGPAPLGVGFGESLAKSVPMRV